MQMSYILQYLNSADYALSELHCTLLLTQELADNSFYWEHCGLKFLTNISFTVKDTLGCIELHFGWQSIRSICNCYEPLQYE